MTVNKLGRILLLIMFCITGTMVKSQNVVYPEPLKPGDKIAVLAPASAVDKSYVDQSLKVLREIGYEPVVYKTAYGRRPGDYSGTPDERFNDLKAAFEDPEIKAILCARGGYGVVHNLDRLAQLDIEANPKWVIGFSDITAMHGFMKSKGIASIHSSMCHHIRLGKDDTENIYLFDILQGKFPTYEIKPDPRNHHGEAKGRILGGNLSVLQALINTPYDLVEPGTILFIEDLNEPIYKVERMLYQLKMAGMFDKLEGLVIGQFTKYRPDGRYTKMEDMMAAVLADYPDLPVAFNAPIGHVTHNNPIVESSMATLKVTPEGVTLTMQPE